VALAERPWHLVLLYGVVASIGNTGSGILPVSVHVSRWFPAQRGFAMAVTASGFSLGQLVFTQVAAHTAAAVGWRATYGLMAAVLAVFLAVLAGWLRDAPAAPLGARSVAAAGHPPPGGRALDRRGAMATPAFWWLTASFVGCGFTDFLLTTHLAAFATDVGLSQAVAANAFSVWAAANVVGILLAGWMAARLGPHRALVATYLVRAASLVVLPGVREPWQLYGFAVLFGSTFFTTAPLSSTLVGAVFGVTHQGVIFGAATLFHHLAGALGSYAGGLAFDRVGSYAPTFLAGAVMVLVSAGATVLVRRPR
jgi:predicted MFS family arabinose efflux permease